jgi:phosphohistidine phosphatase
MKQLIIVRHGKSDWSYPELADIERPLKTRGVNDGHKMGEVLKSRGIYPDVMISSPANRAYSTAQIIASVLEYHPDKLIQDEAIYHAGVRELIKIIKKFNNSWASVMIYGHNPGFTDLANHFCSDYIENVPTTGIVILNFRVDDWRAVDAKNIDSEEFDFPKNHSSKKGALR